jgi:NTP pyrophosphatase (non-canonical NTP hydrolase)
MQTKFRYNVRHEIEPAPVPEILQTCLVWMRFISACVDGSQTLASRFCYWDKESILSKPKVESVMDIKQLTEEMNNLVRSKGWYEADSKRPQTPRNLAISLSVEAAEILEHFQFQENAKDKKELASELADVALYLLQLASVSEIDLEKAILDKIEINKTREWDNSGG